MKKTLFAAFLFFLAVLLIAFPDIGEEAVRSSMTTAVRSVIPSLFSFMVLSDIILSSNIISEKNRLLAPIARIFSIPKAGAAVFILGNLSGFPVGARVAARQCERGLITQSEASRLAVISNNVSTAFVISFVGAGLFSSRALGVTMYLCQLAAAIVFGIVAGIFSKRKNTPVKAPAKEELEEKTSGIFVKAVNDAATACLGISAFIVIFGVISSYVKVILEGCLSLPPVLTAVITSFLEISNGCISASELTYPASVAVCAFAVGFSGISVLCQSSMFLKRVGVSVLPIAAAKIFQGILTAVLTLISVEKLNISLEASVILGTHSNTLTCIISVCAAAILVVYLLFKIKSAFQIKHNT